MNGEYIIPRIEPRSSSIKTEGKPDGTPPPGLPDELLPEYNTVRKYYDLTRHSLPRPDWMVHGFAESPQRAWQQLEQLASERSGAISIYVHIPFCASRCAFCDCHATLAARPDSNEITDYITRLIQEARRWSGCGILARRPVTTVHFGGGTANYISAAGFRAVVQCLRDKFNITSETEFAVETTCRCLMPAKREVLSANGFKRIHIGVQTLKPCLRRQLGRPTPTGQVMERVRESLDEGWIVSADLLYGLPRQSCEDLLGDVGTLVTAGVHGVSLYRLNASEKNRTFILRHGLDRRGPEDEMRNYVMFVSAARYLRQTGFGKTHFAHYSRMEDRNLYSRCASRGEDLLALGAYADGYFGPYYYRHSGLESYRAAADQEPALEGGGFFDLSVQGKQQMLIHLMANTLSNRTVRNGWQQELVRRWRVRGILTGPDDAGAWELTDSGSWVLPQCLQDLPEEAKI